MGEGVRPTSRLIILEVVEVMTALFSPTVSKTQMAWKIGNKSDVSSSIRAKRSRRDELWHLGADMIEKPEGVFRHF